jgi:hypothetical protein
LHGTPRGRPGASAIDTDLLREVRDCGICCLAFDWLEGSGTPAPAIALGRRWDQIGPNLNPTSAWPRWVSDPGSGKRAVAMKIGFHLTPFWSPADRGATRIIDEAVRVVAAASRMGFAWVSIGQHFVSHPTVWPQPFLILARLAPETAQMRLKTSVLLLPVLNPVEVAENVATLDHICHGRLDVGVAIGYREEELETGSAWGGRTGCPSWRRRSA